MKPIQTVAFVGIGAVGSNYARFFAKNEKGIQAFAVVRDPAYYLEDPVTLNGVPLNLPVYKASDMPAPADLILLSVKTHHLVRAIQDFAPLVGENTQILSLLNGIDSEETLAETFGWSHVLYAICSGVDANRCGHHITMNRPGEICFGEACNKELSQRVMRIRDTFEAVGLPYRIPLDMRKKLWWKFMVNVGVNQVSAIKGLRYGELRNDPEAMSLMRQAQKEVLMIAQAEGIPLTDEDILRWEEQLATLSAEGRSSTLHDLWQKRRTEADSFGGEVLRRGLQHGIATPVNAMLQTEIFELEGRYHIP